MLCFLETADHPADQKLSTINSEQFVRMLRRLARLKRCSRTALLGQLLSTFSSGPSAPALLFGFSDRVLELQLAYRVPLSALHRFYCGQQLRVQLGCLKQLLTDFGLASQLIGRAEETFVE